MNPVLNGIVKRRISTANTHPAGQMKNDIPLPTPYQKRLVDIAFVIQFHLTALGHLAVWCFMYRELLRIPHVPDEGRFIVEIFVYTGIPISFGVLVAVYILFRCLLAYAKFTTAMTAMICLNMLHAVVMFAAIITPLRLLIPTVLYGIACYSYRKELESGKVRRPLANTAPPEPEQ